MIVDKFGFLPNDWPLSFDDFEICPVEQFDEIRNFFKDNANVDGYYYPPNVFTARTTHPDKEEQIVPNSKKPALLYQLPASHYIKTKKNLDLQSLRLGEFGFSINLIGYYFGYRLQFVEWWVDGRVHATSQHGIVHDHIEVENFLHHSLRQFRKFEIGVQKRFINLLFLINRAPAYNWDWERFIIEYIIFDGCWKIFEDQYRIKGVHHKDRMSRMLAFFKMHREPKYEDLIISLRNDLFHEGLWDKTQPCSARTSDSYYAGFFLRDLNQRLIPALLKYPTQYTKSPWTSRCVHGFS